MTAGIQEKIFLRGTLTALTGLRVGGSDQGLSVGGLNNIVIRHALLNEPYLPGSSIRGKIRCSLERLQGLAGPGHGEMIAFGPCDDPNEWSVQLFGCAAKEGASIPSRVLVRDALLTAKTRELLAPLRGDLPMTETKTEVCIDRVTSAANPRTFERVPAGAMFAFEMVLEVRAVPAQAPEGATDAVQKLLAILSKARHQDNHWGRDKDLEQLLIGLDLLQDDALGGQGSRGYGRVKVTLEPLQRRTRDDYLQGAPEQEIKLTETLEKMRKTLNERGQEEWTRVRGSLPGAEDAP